MDFWLLYLNFWYWVYLLGVPLVIFFVNDKTPPYFKSGHLFLLILLLPLLTSPLDYARTQAIDGFISPNYECWAHNLYTLILTTGISIVYIGWWEAIRRILSREFSWNIPHNFKFGILSTLIIIISLFITTTYALAFIGYNAPVTFMFDAVFSTRTYIFNYTEALFC